MEVAAAIAGYISRRFVAIAHDALRRSIYAGRPGGR